ncbi:S1C family serine protease [Cellulomonas marina]|uniref:Putative serine protease PepD n=1 Tax=Cellulomonas marina TaxID=988821 RepID=A0A1I0XJ30_9CELL|nr:trypsin-like peptidase domain-containing protein [Cellulomonas marina]GIG30090.1 serine protease [Cellulomonas marina]SFB01012.1 putative serine protease PepD [Cellulomonas marina]
MTTTPEGGHDADQRRDAQHPSEHETQPIPPLGATQPVPSGAREQTAGQPWSAPARPSAAPLPWGAQQAPAPGHQHGSGPYAPYAQQVQQPQTQQGYAQQGYGPFPPQASGPLGAAGADGTPPTSPFGPFRDGAPSGPPAPRTRRRRRVWLPVGLAALLAAGVGVGGSVLASEGLDGDLGSGTRSASIADLGQASGSSPAAGSSSVDSPDWEAVATAVQQSVVAIQVQTAEGGAEGSGVVVDDEGHIVTNNHVVSGAEAVNVTLSDGRLFEAEVAGTDPTTDLAVVRLTDPPADLTVAALGDSDAVVVGQPVMAVGNPLGLANTVTTGIVSALDRPVTTSETGSSADAAVTNALQTDAAINPGNSGGPLFDGEGNVIGINSSIATLSSESGSVGLGFAIPVNLMKTIASQLIEDGTAEHAFLGVSLRDTTATADGVTRRGAQVVEVTAGSPAADAELQADDVVVAINDQPVAGAESLTAYVRELSAGDQVTLTLVRDGASLDVDATLAAREETPTSGGGDVTPGSEETTPDPDSMTPQELWEWFQQQQGQG